MDFIKEMYHPDHMMADANMGSMFEAPKISGSNVELVFLLEDGVVCQKVREAMAERENSLYRSRVTVYQGTVEEGIMSVRGYDAAMIFVLPNLYAVNVEEDDDRNVMRVLYLKQALTLDVRIVRRSGRSSCLEREDLFLTIC